MKGVPSLLDIMSTVKWRDVPLGLTSYLAYSVIVPWATVAVEVSGLDVHKMVPPIVGWPLTAFYSHYIGAIAAANLIVQRRERARKFLLFVMFLQIGIGIEDYVYHRFLQGYDYGNPYLMMSAWRPVLTILLPTIWLLMATSNRVKHYSAMMTPNQGVQGTPAGVGAPDA